MGTELRYACPVETRRMLWMVGLVFAVVVMVQFFVFPYGDVLSSLFSSGIAQIASTANVSNSDSSSLPSIPKNKTFSTVHDFANTSIGNNTANMTNLPDRLSGKDGDADGEKGNKEISDNSISTDGDLKDQSPSKDFSEPSRDPKGEKLTRNNSFAPEKAIESSIDAKNTSLDKNSGEISIPTSVENINLASLASPQPPQNASETNLRAPSNLNQSTSSTTGDASGTVKDMENTGEFVNVPAPSPSHSSVVTDPKMQEELPTKDIITLSDMNNMLEMSLKSFHSVKPRWSSVVDQELLRAKYLIENAPTIRDDTDLHAPLYRNISLFKRSYEIMEQTLKVYIYTEGEEPIFHHPPIKGIYASEGWFMKVMKENREFVTRDPKKAHLFYLPFSSRMLEETLYVPNSNSLTNLVEYLSGYLDLIISRYNFWNRTAGADHFVVACHDWGPAVTKTIMANCIRALCNANIKEDFQFGKDASLPETLISSPKNLLRYLGGKPPSERHILAFFAGKMHGYLRPILMKYWENRDPDMKISRRMKKVKVGQTSGPMSYIDYMKSSKYCICAKGYEVNSPRVVEAIFYECVPVIISDNFVPPLFETLNWASFAVFIPEKDIPDLKNILLSIPEEKYLQMQQRVKQVQQHFLWHAKPVKYDVFHMILHSIWYNRVFGITT